MFYLGHSIRGEMISYCGYDLQFPNVEYFFIESIDHIYIYIYVFFRDMSFTVSSIGLIAFFWFAKLSEFFF